MYVTYITSCTTIYMACISLSEDSSHRLLISLIDIVYICVFQVYW